MFKTWFKALSRPTREEKEQEELRETLRQTRSALVRAYDGFNRAGDPDLIDSYVYEINSLQSRYSYLLRQARLLEPAGELQ